MALEVGSSGGLHLAQVGKFPAPRPQQGLRVLSLRPVLNGPTGCWDRALWKQIWFAFYRAPKVQGLVSGVAQLKEDLLGNSD